MPISYKVAPRKSKLDTENRAMLAKIGLLLGGIVVVSILFYLWLFVATANINNFWGLFRRDEIQATSGGLFNTAPATPTLSSIPEAVSKKTLTIKGFAEAGLKTTLYLNEISRGETVVDNSGSFIFNDVILNTNTATIYVKTKNDRGQESAPSKSYTVVFDETAPKLTVKKPQDGDKFIDAGPFYTVEGILNEDGTVLVNDHQASLDSDNNFRLVIGVKEGDNFLKIKATDKAGNMTEVERKLIYEKP